MVGSLRSSSSFIKLVLLACSISYINVVFPYNKIIGFGLVIIEVIVLFVKFFQKSLIEYLSLYLIFVCNCQEFSNSVYDTHYYNIKDIRIGGINIAAIMLIPPIIKVLLGKIKIKQIKKEYPNYYKYGLGLIVLNLIALFIGALLVMINDNSVQSYGNVIYLFIKKGYSVFLIPLSLSFVFIRVEEYNIKSFTKLYFSILATLYACVFQLMVSSLYGIYVSYGGLNNSIAVSSLTFFIPFLLLFSINTKRYAYSKLSFVIGTVGIVLLLVFNSGGKLIISTIIALIILVKNYLTNRGMRYKLTGVTIVLAFIMVFIFIIPNLMDSNILFRMKAAEVENVFNISDDNWLSNMSASPRARVEEIKDVFIEFGNKPWLIVTGKGYLGTILDHTNYFASTTNQHYFSELEWSHMRFYNLHEIIQNLLLFGVIGVLYSVKLIQTCRKHKKSIFMFVGTIWFIIMYGYSFTIGVLGNTILFYGLIEDKLYKEKCHI